MNFLFWNINKKDLTNEIVALVEAYKIDVLILIECMISSGELLDKLNHTTNDFYYSPRLIYRNKNILFFSKFSSKYLKDVSDEPRYFTKQLIRNNNLYNIVVTHYPSKLNWSDDDQVAAIPDFSNYIKTIENNYKNDNTIVLGDFNMNPFEKGMIQINGLHTTMDRHIALKEKRVVNDKEFKYFYNPMWSFYGELGVGKTHGTYYYKTSKPISYDWNIFDQVLLRPSLLGYFDDRELQIITEVNKKSLLNKNGIINNKNFSDHLPVKFTLKI